MDTKIVIAQDDNVSTDDNWKSDDEGSNGLVMRFCFLFIWLFNLLLPNYISDVRISPAELLFLSIFSAIILIIAWIDLFFKIYMTKQGKKEVQRMCKIFKILYWFSLIWFLCFVARNFCDSRISRDFFLCHCFGLYWDWLGDIFIIWLIVMWISLLFGFSIFYFFQLLEWIQVYTKKDGEDEKITKICEISTV